MSYTLLDEEPTDGEIRCPNRTDQTVTPNSNFWIYASLAALCVVVLTACDFRSDFELAPNGITVLCDDAEVGDTGAINGTVYTKRTADQITTGNAATTCTSDIISMESMFRRATSFNEDISSWDVSSVISMESMFGGATSVNPEYAPERRFHR